MRALLPFVLAVLATGCGGDEPVRTVEPDAVIAALVDAATGADPKAVGAGCTPPAEEQRLEEAWNCEVTYRGSPQRTLKYRLEVEPDGCWSAADAEDGRRLSGCGLRVGRSGS